MSQFSQIYADEPSPQQPQQPQRAPEEKAHFNEQEQPSHAAVELGNPASFKPKYLVLDDINIDLITVFATVSTLISIFVLGTPGLLTAAVAAAIIFPLRAFFPRPTTPQGTVLITGASSGIGAELSYIFAEHGHDLVLVGRDKEQLENVKNNVESKYGKTARTIALDLSVPGKPKQLYDQVKGEGLTVEVLVNNAGLGAAGETLEQPIELAERMTTLNCIALVQLTLLFGNDMLKRGRGWLLHVSSVGGKFCTPLPYSLLSSCLRYISAQTNSPRQVGWQALVKTSTTRRNTMCASSPSLSPSSYAVTLGSSTPN
jgi:NAD(P)-dependent dehydrogenase (short-subunit alcohol dehydrogenase family)